MWGRATVDKATVTIRIVDTETVTVYHRGNARDDVFVIAVPADVQVLVSTVAEGYLPNSILFLSHHRTGQYVNWYPVFVDACS